MSPSPSVSIAIRAYRREWLGEAIASVLAQTHSDLELVVYDDRGDLDDVTASFADPRLRYHRAVERLGPAGRYTAALALCRGEFVGILDDDDRYEPEFVARLVEPLETDPSVGVVASRLVWEWDGRRLLGPARPPGRQLDVARALLAPGSPWTVTPSTTLFRRAAFLDGERSLPMPDGVAPDTFVNVRAAAAGWGFVHVDEPLVVKHWHAGQFSRSRDISRRDLDVRTWQLLELDDPELDGLRRQNLARALIRRAGRALLGGDASQARADLQEARAQEPGSRALRRRALGLAARAPLLGRAALRLYLGLPHVRRRHGRPPAADA